MKISSLLKKCFLFTTNRLRSTTYGRQLYELLLVSFLDNKITITHGGVDMVFSVPNGLTRYRSDTFSTKEPTTLTWLEAITNNAVLWDVGANVGLYSVYPAKRNGVKVFAFEPSVFNLELLARNIFLNGLQQRITIVPVALSEACGPNLFSMSTTAWGGALSNFGGDFDQHGDKLESNFEYKTTGTTIDQAIWQLGIPAPQFIKIDVDGIEHLILRGGLETLKTVESVLIEIDDCFKEQADETARILRNAGLKLYRKCDGDGLSQYNQWWVREGI